MTNKTYQAHGVITAADVTSIARLELIAATNPVHNGGFNVWQRGATFVAAANGMTADRWTYVNISSVVHTVQRSTDVPAVAALVPLTNYSLHLDVTTADASIGASDVCAVTHAIEGYAWVPFAQKQFTIGFWVKDTITGIHCVSAVNTGDDRVCVMEYTVNVADTWEYKTLTFPASPSSGTWDYTTGVGVKLRWVLACGSLLQTTAGSWQTNGLYGTSSQVNSLSSTSNNFRLWGVTMGLGSTVAPFWPRSYGEELALCKRYFERFGPLSGMTFATGNAFSTTQGFFTFPHSTKRATPTLTMSTASNFAIQYGATVAACTAVSGDTPQADISRLSATVGSAVLTVGNAVRLVDNVTTAATIDVSAEL